MSGSILGCSETFEVRWSSGCLAGGRVGPWTREQSNVWRHPCGFSSTRLLNQASWIGQKDVIASSREETEQHLQPEEAAKHSNAQSQDLDTACCRTKLSPTTTRDKGLLPLLLGRHCLPGHESSSCAGERLLKRFQF